MKPGDRKRRWRTSYSVEAAIFFLLGIGAVFGVNGKAGLALGAGLWFMGALAVLNAYRGEKPKEGRPPWADKHDKLLEEDK